MIVIYQDNINNMLKMATPPSFIKMSNADVDSDGFQKVKSKRFAKNKPTKIPPRDIFFDKEEVFVDIEKVIQRIQSSVEDLRVSDYIGGFLNSVSSSIKGRNVVEIVCFGLGHVSECNISRYQLALLLCLKDHFKPLKVLTHDPIFYKGECEVLNKLGCEVITENNEGSYVIADSNVTIVYLPHCPKQLTNNFLWSNWSTNLENCILICNSFNSLLDNNPSRIVSETVPYIYKIFPHTSEDIVENNFKFTDIFNDTSIHHFPRDKLKNLDPSFWNKENKPTYENTEEFITSLMIQKLNI